jgi:hypothetical protein
LIRKWLASLVDGVNGYTFDEVMNEHIA